MHKTSEQLGQESGEKKDIFKIWADSYSAVSKIWEDSYTNLYKPWIESTGDLYNKAIDITKNPTEENYREFFNEWTKAYQSTFGRFYPVPTERPDREVLERLAANAEATSGVFKSWAEMLDENAQNTRELLKGTPDPEKYRESYGQWMKIYEKIFNEFMTMPPLGGTGEIFGRYGAIPGIYMRDFAQIAKLWRESYSNLYWPWINSMMRLAEKTAEVSRGGARPEAYREFYNLWMETYKETYTRFFNAQAATRPSKEMLDSFLKSTDVYLNMYKSWMSALDKMSSKTMELSRTTTDPEAYREFYNTWTKMYERAFDDLFRYMPMVGPMRNAMEPIKNAAKAYTDMFANLSNIWMRSTLGSTSRV